MMTPKWLKLVLIAAVSLLLLGIFFALVVSRQSQGARTEEELKILAIIAAIGFNGFLFASIALWLNEFFARWGENKDFYDRIAPIFWLVITNIYGAYYFSFKRIKNQRTHLH